MNETVNDPNLLNTSLTNSKSDNGPDKDISLRVNDKIDNKNIFTSQNKRNSVNIDMVIIGRKSSSTSMQEENYIEKVEVKTNEMKKEFVKWSLLTKYDGYSKIFQTNAIWVKILWTLLFLIFSGLTALLVIKNITDYLKYEVTSIIEVKIEKPSDFPTITICNNNPFTSIQAKYLMDNISFAYFNATIENMTYNQSFDYYSNISELTKMFVSSPLYSQTERENLEHKSILDLKGYQFNDEDCLKSPNKYTRKYFSYVYGNCFQFNSGLTDTNSPVNLLKQIVEGSQYGLTVKLGPIFDRNKYFSSLSDGLVAFIHNQSYQPVTAFAIRLGLTKMVFLPRLSKINQDGPSSKIKQD